MRNLSAKTYEFGGFRLSEDEKILFRGDSVVEVTPKAIEILLVLVENAGRIVPKEEIFQKVWAGSFVEEANLSHHIFRLRKALGEDKRLKFIETVPKRGYRFAAGKHTENSDAYALYLQGRFFLNQNTEENVEKSIPFFDRAVALDPRYASAYAARAEAHYMSAEWTVSNNEAIPKAKTDLATALSLDDTLVEALTLSAYIKYQYDWDFAASEVEFKKAVALNPSYADAHRQYGWYLPQIGLTDEGLAEMKLALQLDPFSPQTSVDLAAPLIKSRQYDAAVEQLRRSIEMHPNFFLGRFVLGWARVHKDEYAALYGIVSQLPLSTFYSE